MRYPGAVTIDNLNAGDLPEIGWSGSAMHVRYVAEELERAKTGKVEYLAVRDQAGCALSIGLIDHVRHEGVSEIGQLATNPVLQSQGLGTVLIRGMEERIRARGHVWSVLGVEAENTRARQLYDRLGYQVFGRDTDSWMEEDETGAQHEHVADIILMRKQLRGDHPQTASTRLREPPTRQPRSRELQNKNGAETAVADSPISREMGLTRSVPAVPSD